MVIKTNLPIKMQTSSPYILDYGAATLLNKCGLDAAAPEAT